MKPSDRRLTLIGNSTGPLRDRQTWRRDRVDSTTSSSILAFREGRPMLTTVEQLGIEFSSSRWKTFLSTPIFVHVEAPGKNGGGLVPVGVVTIASSLSVDREMDDGWSVFRDLERPMFEQLKVDIIAAGRSLLSPVLADKLAADEAALSGGIA